MIFVFDHGIIITKYKLTPKRGTARTWYLRALRDRNAPAARIAELIRAKAEASENGVCPATISVGVSEYSDEDYNRTVKKADDALYKAKNSGRNKVVVYSEA